MTTDQIIKDCRERMEKALDVFRNELKGLRTGRATPALLDSVRMDYYGSPTPIKNVASVSTPDAQSIMIKPFNVTDLKEIEKAIRGSDLGLVAEQRRQGHPADRAGHVRRPAEQAGQED